MPKYGASGAEQVESRESNRRPIDYYRQVGTSPFERRYAAGCVNGGSLTTGAPAVDVIRALPIVFPRGGSLDRLSFCVSTLAVAGVARAGIYKATSERNIYPDSLLVDGGEQSTATTGEKDATISAAVEAGQLYWIAYLAGTLACTIECFAAASLWPIYGLATALGSTPGVAISVAQAYGALPSTFPAGGSVLTAAPFPALRVRVAS